VSFECAQISLGDLFDFKNGRGFRKAEWRKSGLPIIRIQNLNDPNASFNHFQGDYDPSIYVTKGDLLYSWSGSVGTSFGPHLWQGQEGLLNQHIFKLEPKRPINRIFAYYMLRHITREIEQSVHGAVGLVHISKSKLESFKIPVPELTEQQHIVAKLDELNADLRKVSDCLDAKLLQSTQLLVSVAEELFAGTSGTSAALGEVCHLATGGTPSTHNRSFYENGEIKWLRSGDVHMREICDCEGRITAAGMASANTKFLPLNSVLIALAGQGKTRGTVAMLRTQATCNQSVVSIMPQDLKSLLPEFVYWYLRSKYDEIRRLTGDDGNDRRGLNMRIIRGLEVPVPPMTEQKRIVAKAELVHSVSAEVLANIERRKVKAGELRESVLAAAFRGEL